MALATESSTLTTTRRCPPQCLCLGMPSRFLEHAPETVDELMLTVRAVRELIETAKRAEDAVLF